MAKAQITLPDGVTVTVEDATPDEIARTVERLTGKARGASTRRASGAKPQRPLLSDHLTTLLDNGFFKKKPKDLGSVKVALEEMGHHYPVTTLSGAMLSMVRKRLLRRLKQEKRWTYTG